MWYLGQKPWCDVSTRKRTCRAVVIQSPLGVRLSPDLYRQVVASIWIDRVRKDLPNRVVPRMSGSNRQISRLFRAHFRPRGGCFACRFLSWVKAWRRLFPTYVFLSLPSSSCVAIPSFLFRNSSSCGIDSQSEGDITKTPKGIDCTDCRWLCRSGRLTLLLPTPDIVCLLICQVTFIQPYLFAGRPGEEQASLPQAACNADLILEAAI